MEDQVPYISSFFEFEFAELGQTWFVDEIDWLSLMLNPDVDPEEHTKPYGILIPHYIENRWRLGVCPPRLASYVESDEELKVWLEYWLAYVKTHLHLLGEAERDLSFSELAQRVRVSLEDEAPDLCFDAYEFKERQPSSGVT